MNHTSLSCPHCQGALEERHIDRQREIATCPACSRLVDVRQLQAARAARAADSGKARARPPVQLPPGMMFATLAATGGIEIRRPWLRGKHWFFLLACAIGSAVVAKFWLSEEPSAWLIVGTLFVLNWDFMVLAMFVNLTTIHADPTGVRVKHGPLPSLFGRNASITRERLKQLYATWHGTAFAVKADLTDGSSLTLVAPLVSAEQALFIEQQLERVLGLVDFAVEGELGADEVAMTTQGEPIKGSGPGLALALIVPTGVLGTLALFFLVAQTTVKGQLRASGDLGDWTLAPGDCVSGQREGFGGVVLTSKTRGGRTLRVVNDPIKGTLLVLVQPGRDNQVIEKSACARFDVQTVRTNTSVNDIWAVDGHVAVECPGLRGNVTFEGCH